MTEVLMVKVLMIARTLGVLNLGSIGLDGSKINVNANASKHSVYELMREPDTLRFDTANSANKPAMLAYYSLLPRNNIMKSSMLLTLGSAIANRPQSSQLNLLKVISQSLCKMTSRTLPVMSATL
ncbi:hypothetical protein [Candidatus Nitrotoga sp. M5]|uniref:hypothetical protein n=1 Tax=Candidatus Nitrotoga sp. M5 TaxID=2890409 RepID=UPI001EF27635|nr:hypothetical protein [Candidatus Nitrotoga sp. M5]